MEFLLIICHDAHFVPTPALIADILAWNREMTERRILKDSRPLRPPTDATTVRVRNGATKLTTGPFAATREKMAAYALIDCANQEEAIAVASCHPMATAATIEIRPVWSDLPGDYRVTGRGPAAKRGRLPLRKRFVSEAVTPVPGTFDAARMASGEPGLPREFVWRGETVRIAHVRRQWRETGPCRHGSGERYVRKHWYEVETGHGLVLTLYFERKPRGMRPVDRWRLFSAEETASPTR